MDFPFPACIWCTAMIVSLWCPGWRITVHVRVCLQTQVCRGEVRALGFQQWNVMEIIYLGFPEQREQVRCTNTAEKEVRRLVPSGLCCGLVIWRWYFGVSCGMHVGVWMSVVRYHSEAPRYSMLSNVQTSCVPNHVHQTGLIANQSLKSCKTWSCTFETFLLCITLSAPTAALPASEARLPEPTGARLASSTAPAGVVPGSDGDSAASMQGCLAVWSAGFQPFQSRVCGELPRVRERWLKKWVCVCGRAVGVCVKTLRYPPEKWEDVAIWKDFELLFD